MKSSNARYIPNLSCKDQVSISNFPVNVAIENIQMVSNCCEKIKIHNWLSGRTLLYIQKVGFLPNDNFDSVAIKGRSESLNSILINDLITSGFILVKMDAMNILFSRKGRYLEICKYVSDGGFLRHNKLIFKKSKFKNLQRICINGYYWNIPDHADELIHDLYINSKNRLYFSSSPYLKDSNFPGKELVKKVVNKFINISPPWLENIFYSLGNINKTRKELTENEFREVLFEEDSVNWQLRKTHLDLITCKGKYRKIGEIIDYLKRPVVLQEIKAGIHETEMLDTFLEPIYYNKQFWQSGNNYFINCIIYSFRKKVVPYEEIANYVYDKSSPKLFSAEYYLSLDPMSEKEISNLLRSSPIMIENNTLISGRHRVCAMIGRLVAGQSYLPIHVLQS